MSKKILEKYYNVCDTRIFLFVKCEYELLRFSNCRRVENYIKGKVNTKNNHENTTYNQNIFKDFRA